jgi:hypothetical protein
VHDQTAKFRYRRCPQTDFPGRLTARGLAVLGPAGAVAFPGVKGFCL